MNLYASISMAQRVRITSDNPLGWTQWGLDHDAVLARAESLRGRVQGIGLQRACGSLAFPRHVANRTDGSPVWVWPASPEDHPLPFDLAAKLAAMGFQVLMFAGWPLTSAGYEDIATSLRAGFAVATDSSGGASNGQLVASRGCTIEPAPMPMLTPPWFRWTLPIYTLAGRAVTLERLGYVLPPHAHVAWNGDPDGDSCYEAGQVERWASRGNPVHVPLQFVDEHLARLETRGSSAQEE